MPDTNELDRCRRDLEQVKAALNDPKIGLFASRKLYARYGALLRQVDALEVDLAVNHVKGEPHETEIATHPTVYRNG